MVKFFGVIFLGQPREDKLAQAHDAGPWERVRHGLAGLGCVALGLLPTQFIQLIDPVTQQLVGPAWAPGGGQRLAAGAQQRGAGQLRPGHLPAGHPGQPGAGLRRGALLYHGRMRRSLPWACGFPWGTARMQDTAEGFGQPIRQIFEPFFLMQRELPTPFDARPRYRVVVEDHFWRWLYVPIMRPGGLSGAPGQPDAAGPHLGVPDVQLRDAGGHAAGGDAMTLP
jgi:hydrogenase-4 component B